MILYFSDAKSADDNHNIEHLNRLKDLNIDLTAYLANQQSPAVTEELQVVNVKASPHKTHF